MEVPYHYFNVSLPNWVNRGSQSTYITTTWIQPQNGDGLIALCPRLADLLAALVETVSPVSIQIKSVGLFVVLNSLLPEGCDLFCLP